MRVLTLTAIVSLLCACGAVSNSTPLDKAESTAQTFEGPVPRAVCGPGSQPELGAQGRVARAEVESGRSKEGYWCNLEPVGREGDGALWQMAWYEDCAYYGLGVAFAQGNTAGQVPGQPAKVPGGGVAVVKVTDPAAPERTATLTTPAMLDPWESLKVNERRGLLAGSAVSIEGSAFDVYDVKKGLATDCSQPVLLGSTDNGMGHEGEWSPDGLTYWSSGFIVASTSALDLTVPQAPHVIATINDGIHGLSLNEEGTRLYAAEHSRSGAGEQDENLEEGVSTNGLEIWDTSAIQTRATGVSTAAAPAKVVGSVYWDDGAVAQMTIPVVIQGKPYVIFIDEGGKGDPQSPGMARIIDVSDETHPVVVSKLKNEINMLDHADQREADGGASGFTYQGHYCGVPQRIEPGVVACSYFWQGIRVFDIRDPHHPKEIAYIIPPLDENDDGRAHTSSQIRFVPERGEIWFTNQNTGFHVARFTNGVWPFPN
ncbi:MAG TPA: hypothetical protein VM240_09665 [Verrucomicrobiae bacterium]|nr:hypothetical protein [Verrucomicrobiae bacterium]